MKKVFIITCTAIIVSLSAFANESSYVIKEATNLSQEELKNVLDQEDSYTVVKFSSGDIFPLKIDYQSEFFALDIPKDVPYSVSIKRDFFVRSIRGENFLFSLDGTTWKTFSEMTTGIFQVGFGIEDNSPVPHLTIGGHISERTQPKKSPENAS